MPSSVMLDFKAHLSGVLSFGRTSRSLGSMLGVELFLVTGSPSLNRALVALNPRQGILLGFKSAVIVTSVSLVCAMPRNEYSID
jgi:hypothetical protein